MVDTTRSPAAAAAAPPRTDPTDRLFTSGWFRSLFVAELWERFGFYGMQAVLVLYAVAPRDQGGLGLSAGSGAALFGAFIGITFMFALPGGWLADRVLGQQRAMVAGLALISVGCFTLALPPSPLTLFGLLFISAGFGLFKPNHQALVNMLAGTPGRREATLAAFFVGIQAIGLLAPLVIGAIGERVSFRLAFATIGAVVAVGVLTTAAGRRALGTAGAHRSRPLSPAERRTLLRRLLPVVGALVLLLVVGLSAGVVPPQAALGIVGLLLIAAPWGAYRRLRRHPELTGDDRWRLSVMLRLMLAATIFWLLAGQDGSVLTLFAKDSTDRTVFGFTFPASWLQGATPLFMLLLAPLIAWQLTRIGARVAVPDKFAFGLLLAGVSFLIMTGAAAFAADGDLVSPLWLLSVYLLHALGEIVVAAVSISAIADLVPRAFLGQAIGVYWLFAALGGGLSSQVAALIDVLSGPVYYLSLAVVSLGVGALFMVFRRRLGAPFVDDAPRPAPPAPASRAARPAGQR
ncbi:oligopeptide:H+ symporter [Micromonospora sp. NPDC126480]|uniref:peptide MFS transporter n=1 Tax=Micromonospora sp. NPDC126480 TaxID=3155312 RepID=UPI00332C53DA